MRSTYKSLHRRVAEKQKQLQRAQALCQRLDDRLFALRERMWQTEQGARLRREAVLKWIADIEATERSESPVDIASQSR